jgi:hypothetical protein
MLRQRISYLTQTALLLGLLPLAIASAHGDDHGQNMDMGSSGKMLSHSPPTASHTTDKAPLTYFRLDSYSRWIYGHIMIMTLTWTVLLPLGKKL